MNLRATLTPVSGKKCFYLSLIVLTTVITFNVLRIFNISDIHIPSILEFKSSGVDLRVKNISSSIDNVDVVMEQKDTYRSALDGTAITMEEIQKNFKRCAEVAIKEKKECAKVTANSSLYWRSTGKGQNTLEDDFNKMHLASECCAFNHEELIMYPPRDPMFPWEQDYLSQPPLYNMADTAYASLSNVTLIEREKSQLKVGDYVKFLIVLKNGRGEPRKMGGDLVRLWLVNDTLGAAIAADVTDNNNGSYLATVLLPWSGQVKVKAAIAHTRELFRANFYIQRLFKITHWLTGNFHNGNAAEATPCLPVPSLPGFRAPEICNLTEQNGGYPWYCGKPVKSHLLNCGHWKTTRKIPYPSYYPLTEAEETLIKMTESTRPFRIPTDIVLNVKPDKENETTLPPPKIKCNQRQLSETFEDTNLSGYFYAKKWRPFACQLPSVDREFLLKCLKDTKVIIIGDSNSRAQMDNFRTLTKCTDKIPRTKVIWHAPLHCDIDSLNMSIKYFPPKHPFYGSVGEIMKNEDFYSPIQLLDNIPNHGKYLVHLHDFLHLVPSHLSVVEHRLRLLREAIARLLARNPHVHVVYQSGHIAYDRSKFNKHKMTVFLLELQRSILKGLGDRVMFVLTWPMTIAVENTDGHPEILNEFTALYMGHVCGRQ